ncbi:two-component regulator propeller domain-containing protein, partial [Pseudoalteromonas sp.]|uniref:ligand-binding sensor domain-containing protein n=1 Tax=Pseudoalteromonas sp. TaxID=53249 RepID=UPI003569DDBB
MRQYTNILFFIVLFLLLGNSNAQSFDNPIFTRIYAENGLTQDNITAIEQDAYGFIWIGSQEGLTRWDGSSFEHYLNSPENINSLANDYISDVFTSGDKRLWVATLGGGLHYYSPVANDFVRIVAATQEVNDKLRNIRTLFEDQNNRLWIGTENHGVFLLDLETNQVNAFSVDNSAENPPLLKIRDIKGDNHGRVWIASEGSGISMWDEKKYLLINYSSNTSSNTSIPTNDFYTVQPMPDGTIWAGSYNNGLVIINPYRRESTNWRHEPENYYSLADNRVRSIFRDSRDRIWLGTDNGLDLWDSDIRGFHHFSFDPGARHTLSDNRVTKITQDRGGVLWVGTFSGLNKWNAKLGSISHVKRVPNAPSSLSSNIVTSFADSVQGDIWIGTWGGGLNYYDSSQNKFINYMPSVHDKGALSDHRVMSLLLDSQGRLWVGTMRSGLNLKQPNQDVFIHYKHDKENPESLSFNGITSILEDAEQNIWVATFGGGLNHYQNGKFVRFKHEENNPFSLCGNRIVGMSLDQQDNIWLATDGGGVCYYSPERQKFISVVLNHPSDKNSKITSVVSIFAGKNGVWAGSKDSGLFLINYPQSDENLSIKYFHRQHGLPSNAIMGVLEDDSGMVWVSSYNGISALTPSTREIKNFSINHGLQGMEYNSGAYFKSSDGQLYFGGNNGFNKIDPKQLWLSMNSFKPATIMTKIKIANYQLSMEESVFDVQQLNLSYQQNAIEFEFASLDFTEPEKNLYKYRLLGFSDTWSSESKSKLASYTNLPFGDYTFQVQGSNNAGVWGPIREIKIEIA